MLIATGFVEVEPVVPDNTDKINELVKIHGEEETLSKLEKAQAILGKFD